MSATEARSIVRQIETLFQVGPVSGLSDRQLLERFNTTRDATGETAFAALVGRHGPMVFEICRQILREPHDAEDAFQAVFLVLASRARSIRQPDLLGNWLYGVALRTARCARHQRARRRRRDEAIVRSRLDLSLTSLNEAAEHSVLDPEQAEILHHEIARLPKAFRLPIVLCYFEGLTLDEAARRLRCPAGTMRSRLARAREKLRRRLSLRGDAVPVVVLAAVLEGRSASAAVSSSLCDITAKAAIGFETAGTATSTATAIAQDVLHAMLMIKLKIGAMTCLLLAVAAAGPILLRGASARQAGKPDLHLNDDHTQPAPGHMFVTGRVTDPEGRPVAGMPIDVVGRQRMPWVATELESDRYHLLGHDASGPDGRFRLDASRTSSDGFHEVYALAAAPGFGMGWVQLNADANEPVAEIRLRPEQVVRGRLVDVSGRPAGGVAVRVESLGVPNDLGRHSGVMFWDGPPEGLRAWPKPVKTDDDGRFVIIGIGRGLDVRLDVRDVRFARQLLSVRSDEKEPGKAVTLALEPATIIAGSALAADTGQPIPHAVVAVGASQSESGSTWMKFRADARGRFTANPFPGNQFQLNAFPPDGQPYLVPELSFAWAKGTVTKTIDIKLPRGVLIRGKVSEKGTGRILAGASVQYEAIQRPDNVLGGWQAIVASREDGSFEIVVPGGKGHLLVFGPTSDFILDVIGSQMLYRGRPGGIRNYAHRIIAYEVKLGENPQEVHAILRPGKTVRGRVLGPEGQPVESATIITRLHIESFNPSWRGAFQLPVRDGAFELHGLNPEQSAPVYFLDADHEWGAALELSGKQAGGTVTVRLQPCGQAKARFVGPDRKPIANLYPFAYLLATPGPPASSGREDDQKQLAADAELLANVDRKHHWGRKLNSTDPDGRVTLVDLIPGALYRISDHSSRASGEQVRKDFTVKSGETVDLGDLLIEKPAR